MEGEGERTFGPDMDGNAGAEVEWQGGESDDDRDTISDPDVREELKWLAAREDSAGDIEAVAEEEEPEVSREP